MSSKPTIVLFSAFLIGGFAFFFFHNSSEHQEETHHPHIHSGKHHLAHGKNFRPHAKLIFPFKVEIVDAPDSTSLGDEFNITARISSERDVDVVELSWFIPDGIVLLSGATKETLYQIKAGEPRDIEILLKSNSSENKQIHARIDYSTNGQSFSNITQYNTVLEGEIKDDVEALNQRRLDYQNSK